MRSSVAPSVAPAVPSSTGPGANPAFTVSRMPAPVSPAPAVTGYAAGGTKPVPDRSGKPPAWLATFAAAVGWKPDNPPVRQGMPEALPGGQGANWVQPAIARGIVESDMPPGRAHDTFAPRSGDWTRTQQFTPNDIQSQDVDTAGWINRHPNDRLDFWTLRGADDPDNITYWPAETSQNPDVTPLAVIPGNRSTWVPDGVNSAYTEPAPPQPTASPAPAYQPDPASEWF
jgi:hypothetical protein